MYVASWHEGEAHTAHSPTVWQLLELPLFASVSPDSCTKLILYQPRDHTCAWVSCAHTHTRTLLTTQWCTNSETEEQGRLTAHKLLFRSSSLRVFLFIYFFILERIRQMFEGGDGEEEEKALPSSASSWFLALLLA